MGRYLRRRPVDDIAVHHLSHAICRESNKGRPADGRVRNRGNQGAIALVDGTLWPCWSWDGESKPWAGKYKTTGHGSLIVTNLQGHITFVSEPVTGNQRDMKKLKGSAVEKILKKAGRVFGDKGLIGTDYITTPIRKPKCRKLLQWEREWNNEGYSGDCDGRYLPRVVAGQNLAAR
jgi:DDE superfamily endonuclease